MHARELRCQAIAKAARRGGGGGAIFLDEIGDAQFAARVAVSVVRRQLGSNRDVDIDARIISAYLTAPARCDDARGTREDRAVSPGTGGAHRRHSLLANHLVVLQQSDINCLSGTEMA